MMRQRRRSGTEEGSKKQGLGKDHLGSVLLIRTGKVLVRMSLGAVRGALGGPRPQQKDLRGISREKGHAKRTSLI